MKAYTDGACRISNPGQCSCAFAVLYENGQPVHFEGRYLGTELHTNNWAEFQGLLDLLKWSERKKITGLDIFCDSKLVVETVNQNWNLKEPALIPLRDLAYALLIRGHHILQHIKGHSGNAGNELCDKLCNAVLDKEGIGK